MVGETRTPRHTPPSATRLKGSVAAVRTGASGGRYQLTRISRTITVTRVGFSRASAPRGHGEHPRGRLAGRVGTRDRVVDRFDPLAGWQFLRRYRVRAFGGRAVVSFQPPAVGCFRVRAEFGGTRTASPSESRFSRLQVAGLLRS